MPSLTNVAVPIDQVVDVVSDLILEQFAQDGWRFAWTESNESNNANTSLTFETKQYILSIHEDENESCPLHPIISLVVKVLQEGIQLIESSNALLSKIINGIEVEGPFRSFMKCSQNNDREHEHAVWKISIAFLVSSPTIN
jgi:hypothetical protein